MTLEIGGIKLRNIGTPTLDKEDEDEKNVPIGHHGLPVMSDESIRNKPYFAMYAFDMRSGTFKLVSLPISVFIFQDMIDFDIIDYLKDSMYSYSEKL